MRQRRSPWCVWTLIGLLGITGIAAGQRRVDDRNLGERLILIVPVLPGNGTAQNPPRPLYVPTPEERARAAEDGILSYTVIPSDDKRFALVELVARDRKAFEEILKASRTDVKQFDLQRGKAKVEDIEAEFRKYKRDFTFVTLREGK